MGATLHRLQNVNIMASYMNTTYNRTILIGGHCKKSYIIDVKSSLRLFRPPLTQTQRGLQDHKKISKQNK